VNRSRFPLAALAAAVVALGASVLPAAAQNFAPSNKLLSFGIGGGVTVPVGDAKDAFDNGVNGHGFVRLNLPLFPIQPRFDFSFQRMDMKDVSIVMPSQGPNPYTEGEQRVLAGLAQAQFALLKAGPIQPYLLAGVGFANVETKFEGDPGTDSFKGDATKLAVNGGAGVNIKMGPVSGFLEGRIDNIVNDGEMVAFDSIQLVPISFGIVF
jgi:opacity protein-like surface antigen